MQRLLDSHLLLAQAQTGKRSLPKTVVDLGGLVSRVCEKLGPAAQAKSICLELDCPQGEILLDGENKSLEHMAYNLVENAIFYSLQGGRVTVSVGRAGGGVRLVVEDEGVGIPASELDRIFDRFYQVDPSRSDAQGHAGLGLALVKLIVQMHGGKIDVESVLAEGTRFIVLSLAATRILSMISLKRCMMPRGI